MAVFPPFSYLSQSELSTNKTIVPTYGWARGKFNRFRGTLRLYDWDYELLHLNIDDATLFLIIALKLIAKKVKSVFKTDLTEITAEQFKGLRE